MPVLMTAAMSRMKASAAGRCSWRISSTVPTAMNSEDTPSNTARKTSPTASSSSLPTAAETRAERHIIPANRDANMRASSGPPSPSANDSDAASAMSPSAVEARHAHSKFSSSRQRCNVLDTESSKPDSSRMASVATPPRIRSPTTPSTTLVTALRPRARIDASVSQKDATSAAGTWSPPTSESALPTSKIMSSVPASSSSEKPAKPASAPASARIAQRAARPSNSATVPSASSMLPTRPTSTTQMALTAGDCGPPSDLLGPVASSSCATRAASMGSARPTCTASSPTLAPAAARSGAAASYGPASTMARTPSKMRAMSISVVDSAASAEPPSSRWAIRRLVTASTSDITRRRTRIVLSERAAPSTASASAITPSSDEARSSIAIAHTAESRTATHAEATPSWPMTHAATRGASATSAASESGDPPSAKAVASEPIATAAASCARQSDESRYSRMDGITAVTTGSPTQLAR
mmetsp:Transcript_3528/g.12832  ORF Transcript_3528/g.12832 Transcript_3528/m.12832 type:complete len:471 (-) Transcript_3528:588-2000(-)